ncbi:AraC family transcriptional regulator [Clostridium oryzae]|uniref:Melibiose operon regulatory protein n=1 Tax=Clostridium oryzae TaxID=1450648 RepID=A0A1V4IIM2_9CLOT|nr:AraC family transcriptional regulator [Clostridium oryzae]OPJ59851.1 melibiose operon regulatory protein [Clostridium oryzae]
MDKLIVKNVPVHVKANAPLTLYFCGWEKCEPSHFYGPAIRPHYLIHFVLSGKGSYHVRNKIYQVSAEEMFLIEPGVSTYYEADLHDPWEYVWIGFDGYEAENILKKICFSSKNLIHKDYSCGKLKKSLFELIDNFELGKDNEYAIISRLYQIFSYLLSKDESNDSTASDYVFLAKEYIKNNYSYDMKISDIAKHIGIDRTYLYKLFMQHNNLSPQKYLIQYRLNVAKNMLADKKYSITEILYSCGFRDAASFYKHFKCCFNMTPSQYRKNLFG